jgi:hypothetical protein
MRHADLGHERTKQRARGRFLWPILLTTMSCLTGTAYSTLWPALVRHRAGYWITPSDLWSTVRTAHYIGWGGLSFVYSSRAVFVTLPGFATMLWPVVALTSKLGLSEAAPGILLPKPEAFLVIGPACWLASSVALFGLDALIRRLGVSPGVRVATLCAEAVALWPTTGIWGHPEDAVALGLLAFAFVTMLDKRWTLTAWLLGAAIAMQLLAVLIIPIFLGVAGIRKAVPFLARMSLLPGFYLIAVLVPDFHRALWVLTKQPGFPLVNHPTPWMHFSPVLAPGVVAAGPSRLIAGAIALGAGWYAHRHRDDLALLIYAAAVVFAARCLFESVMVPYYVMPSVAMALLVAAKRGRVRALVATVAALALTVMTHFNLQAWTYYLEMSGIFAVMLLAVTARTSSAGSAAVPHTETIALDTLDDGGRRAEEVTAHAMVGY